jgi:hypothetical protein
MPGPFIAITVDDAETGFNFPFVICDSSFVIVRDIGANDLKQ